MRVLIVEDDAATRGVLAAALSDEGIEVDVAPDGAAALVRLEAGPPDAVLLDLWMPRCDGWSLLADLGDRRPDVPVVVMTAARLSPGEEAGLRAGAAALLRKPLDLDQLLDCLDAVTAAISVGTMALSPAEGGA